MTPPDVTYGRAGKPAVFEDAQRDGRRTWRRADRSAFADRRTGRHPTFWCWSGRCDGLRLLTPDLSGIAFAGIAVAQIASMFLTLNVEAVSMQVLVPMPCATGRQRGGGLYPLQPPRSC